MNQENLPFKMPSRQAGLLPQKFPIAIRMLFFAFFTVILTMQVKAQCLTEDFSAALTLGPTSANGTWYTDRANPNGFAAQSAAPDGRANTLKHSIAAADNRPDDGKNTQSGKNTQGRAFNLPAGATSAQIDLFIPASFATATGRRLAGFWGNRS